jgi:uncharacterized protein (TIGR00299 family) protein
VIAYLDCFSGVSGDKFLGALLDAGFPVEQLREALAGLGLGEHEIIAQRATRGGIACAHVVVESSAKQPDRAWPAIRELIAWSGLTEPVKDGALRTFELLAEAEAKVHGVAVDDVHFHEVGALDSIIDIVGVSAGITALGISELVVSPVAIGFGTVETEHGTLPVPAPATAELLLGMPTYAGEVEGELTTPTGAALVRALATSFGRMPLVVPIATGYGGGTRELPIPNVLRLTIAEPAEAAGADASLATSPVDGTRQDAGSEEVVVLETNIDHLTAEQLSFAAERLLAEGALDVWHTGIVMKKGRPAVAFAAMATPDSADRLASLVMELTGVLGVRVTPTRRIVAPRWEATVETSLGPVRVKVSRIGGRDRVRAEHDDVARIALQTGRPIDEIARLLGSEAERLLEC